MLVALTLAASAATLDDVRADVSDFLTAPVPESHEAWAVQAANVSAIEAEIAEACQGDRAVCSEVVYLGGLTQLVWSDRLDDAGAEPAARAARLRAEARLTLVTLKGEGREQALAASTLATRAAIASR